MADGHRKHRRAPVKPTVDDAIARWRFITYALAATAIIQGGGYLFGSPASAPSLVLMAETHVPVLVWSGLLVIGGLLVLAGRYPAGHGLCALVLLVWAAFSLMVLFQGTATGWGWPWPAGLAAIHGHGLFRSMRRAQLAEGDAGA